MATSAPNQYPVELTEDQRVRFTEITRNGQSPAKKIRHAMILLLSDQNRTEGPQSRTEIAELLGMHVNTVDRIRKRFVVDGEMPALNRKGRLTPPIPTTFDGRAEALLVAICCSEPPEGRARWTLQMLTDEVIKRRIVTTTCVETVRRALKKTNCNLGGSNAGASPSETQPDSSRRWKRSSTSTPGRPRTTNR